MDSNQLAQELRQRFYSYAEGKVEWKVLVAASDYEIIDMYVRCPKCGELYVPVEWVFTAIRLSPSVEEFLNLTDGRLGHLHEDEYPSITHHNLRKQSYWSGNSRLA